jgi:glycine cleavage system transcriptional repressor
MTSLAITLVGHDRPGIIAQAAEVLSQCGMNLEDSSMTLLRGHFAMTLICAGEADAAQVESALAPLSNGSLDVTVREVPTGPDVAQLGSTYIVIVHGADRLGIVARLAGVIAEVGGNITDLTTRLVDTLYALIAEVVLPLGCDVEALRAKLAEVSAELGVETRIRLLENDQL